VRLTWRRACAERKESAAPAQKQRAPPRENVGDPMRG
jgi:hypothetical protein